MPFSCARPSRWHDISHYEPPLMPLGERKILAHLEATAPELVPHFPKYNTEVTAALATDAMLGVDPVCQTWMARFAPHPAGAGRGRRRRG